MNKRSHTAATTWARNLRRTAYGSAAAIALCAPGLAHGQARAQLEKAEDDIVVTGQRDQAPVAAVASRLGLTARETPATVEVLDSETIRRQGYNTLVETVRSAAGVTSADTAAHTPYTMRGFQMAQVSVTHNGINLGSTDFTGMNLGVFNLDRVEFLKGPSSIVSGQGAVGGTINFVTKAPHRGPITGEALFGFDERGSLRTGIGSGGSIDQTVDYRLDFSLSDEQSFIDDSHVRYSHLSGGLDWHVSPDTEAVSGFRISYARWRDLSGNAVGPASIRAAPTRPTSSAAPFVSTYNGNQPRRGDDRSTDADD